MPGRECEEKNRPLTCAKRSMTRDFQILRLDDPYNIYILYIIDYNGFLSNNRNYTTCVRAAVCFISDDV